ncbi:TB2/DP1, HVA22 family [Ancylostoma ceylanicum]|uniref:Receptor expression-enhancing protein n=1 Tax=Ancylostoma ceylanicum TaxID=53326 RepID=A0A0D6L9H2_9BILA|nr:TB2/DP1, HVA22 family [Ancylostoma ceylanicum]
MSVVLSRIVTLTAGTLYPAYRSYKAVRTKDVREYVKWMMYWIVFAIYTFVETLADIFISFWFPFYYQLKIVFVIWSYSANDVNREREEDSRKRIHVEGIQELEDETSDHERSGERQSGDEEMPRRRTNRSRSRSRPLEGGENTYNTMPRRSTRRHMQFRQDHHEKQLDMTAVVTAWFGRLRSVK